MRNLRVLTCVCVLLIFSLSGIGTADGAPLKTNLYGLDGLFLATSGTTIPAGEFAVGASLLMISDDVVDGSTLPISVTYGASQAIEIAAAFELYKTYDDGVDDDSGTGDLYISGKLAIQERTADYPATALGLRLKLPMADYPLSSEETDIAIFAAMDMPMKSVTGILNVEYLIPGGDAENQVNYVVGLEIPFSDTTDFSLELLDNNLVGDMLAGGATFDIGSSLNFGVAIGIGLNDPSADFATQGKLTFTF